MTQTKVKACNSCFFTSKYPPVKIHSNNKCNFCNSSGFHDEKKEQKKFNLDDLKKIAERVKANKKGKYDCMVEVSGGIDSSYILYVVRKLLGLNPLVINYDNGFNYTVARDNLKKICNKLEVDLVVERSKAKYDQKYMKYIVKAFDGMGHYWGVCRPCHKILGALALKYAKKENISTIFNMTNLYEKRLYLQMSFRVKYLLKSLLKVKFYKLPKRFFYLMMAEYYYLRLKFDLFVPPLRNLWPRYPKESELEDIDIGQYVEQNVDHIVELLEKELGWQTKDKRLPMRFDCKVESGLINYTFQNATGITIHGIIANNLIYAKNRRKEDLGEVVERYKDHIQTVHKEVLDQLHLQ